MNYEKTQTLIETREFNETNNKYYAMFIKDTFGKQVEQFGWTLFCGEEVIQYHRGLHGKKIIAIKHENFIFYIENKSEMLKVLKLFSVNAVPSKELWNGKDNTKFHEAMKNKLTDIENAQKLLADYTKPIEAKYKYNVRNSSKKSLVS